MPKRWVLAMLSLLLAGCATSATSAGVVRGGAPERLVFAPRPGRPAVEVSEEQFRVAMVQLAAELEARAEASSRHVVLASFNPPQPLAGELFERNYQSWCQRRHGPADCLSLGPQGTSNSEGKRSLALAIAMGSVMEGVFDEVGGFLSPFKLEAMAVASVGTYLVLLYLPEPISKGLAAFLTVTLYGYLGSELWDVVRAYGQLQDEADAATTFVEVQAAGDRFGHAIGEKTTRVLIMVATARLGSKATAAAKARQLPGYDLANKLFTLDGLPGTVGATIQGGTGTLAGVASRANAVVLGEGRLNVLLAGSMAMAASESGGAGRPGPGTGTAATAPGQAASSADASKRRLEELLKPGGRWIGDKGTSADIRTLRGTGLNEAQKLFDELSTGGTRMTGTSYPGPLVRLPGGGLVGLRPVSESGPPTVEIMNVPGLSLHLKIKFLP